MRSLFVVLRDQFRLARPAGSWPTHVKRLSPLAEGRAQWEFLGSGRSLLPLSGASDSGQCRRRGFGLSIIRGAWGLGRGVIVRLLCLCIVCALLAGRAVGEPPPVVRLYLPPGAPGRNVDRIRETFYRQYRVTPSFV
jgi:hypothetical protein